MRVILLNQFFWPDSSATSQLLTDLARGLVQEGHEVFAICADGSYALADQGDAPDVRIHRIKSLPFVRGRAGRMLSYASFYLGAAWAALTIPSPDLVITLTTPPLLSLLGTVLKIVRGCRHYIWEMDIYPDVAVDLGYFKAGGMTEKIVGRLADWSRRRADGIIALGECMKQRLVARNIPADRIAVADNWADSRAISAPPPPGKTGELTLLYSGNLGLAHDLQTMMGAMLNLRDDLRFHFLFVGSGGRRQELADFVAREQIGSVQFRPYVQRASLGESLGAGDIGLVTQRDVCCGSVVPSKIYGLLAAGRPVLFIGPAEATPARIVQRFQCGWHIACGDVEALTRLLLHLVESPQEIRMAGERAREALIGNFDLPLGVARIAGIVGATSQPSVESRASGAAEASILHPQVRHS